MNNLIAILEGVQAQSPQYKYGNITITAKPIRGNKYGYAGGSTQGAKTVSGYIVIDQGFAKDGDSAEVLNTIQHELAHLIAETVNTTKKRVWHGDAFKAIHKEIGGSGERYHTGTYTKPDAKPQKTMAELYATQPTEPATTWDDGTFRQWLERGYHVVKGAKGSLKQWSFSSDEYETADGKSSKWGHASAFYFANDQVAPNKPKKVEK